MSLGKKWKEFPHRILILESCSVCLGGSLEARLMALIIQDSHGAELTVEKLCYLVLCGEEVVYGAAAAFAACLKSALTALGAFAAVLSLEGLTPESTFLRAVERLRPVCVCVCANRPKIKNLS